MFSRSWDDPASWQASASIGGSPGSADQIAGDADGNGRVDLVDVAIVQAHLGALSGATRLTGDLNGDGMVNRTDAMIVGSNFGRSNSSPGPSAPAAVVRAASARTDRW